MVGGLEALADQSVVVDLAVDGKNNAVIGVGERLSSALCIFTSVAAVFTPANGARI